MIKSILIATDFSLESLEILKKVLKKKDDLNDDNQYNILFVSGYDMGDSITDLLFTSKHSILCKIRSQEFVDACNIINNKYPHLIKKITCDIFTGYFQKSFNNYLETLNIDDAYYSTSKSKTLNKNQFEVSSYLAKNKIVEATEVMVVSPKFVPEKGRLAEVFL